MDFPRMRRLEEYEPLIGAEALDRICQKARSLKHLHVAHGNSTYYSGGGRN